MIYYQYNKHGTKIAREYLHNWYRTFEQSKQVANLDFETYFEIIEKENNLLFKTYNIKGTPAVYINGYMFPKEYEYFHIPLFIDQISNI
jgi:hypothetical protein